MSECGQLVISIIMLVATVVLAIAAIWSIEVAKRTTKVAKRTADSTERNNKWQAMSQVLNEYGSVEMDEHISKLYEAFQDENRARETIDCFKKAWETRDFSKVDKKVNNARRRVAWHFTKIYKLYKVAILKKDEIKELTTEEQVKDIMLGMIEKIDKPCRESGKEVYTFFRTLYPDKNEGNHKEEMAT